MDIKLRKPETKRDHVYFTTQKLIWASDTTIVRAVLALASLFWGLSVALQPQVFSGKAYSLLVYYFSYIGPETWAAMFILHFIGVFWRIYDRESRPVWALSINSYGLALWMTITVNIDFAVGRIAPNTSMNWAMCIVAAWSLYRTGLTKEMVTQ